MCGQLHDRLTHYLEAFHSECLRNILHLEHTHTHVTRESTNQQHYLDAEAEINAGNTDIGTNHQNT